MIDKKLRKLILDGPGILRKSIITDGQIAAVADMSDAYSLGVEAFNLGYELELNPYDQSGAQADEWAQGWMDAYVETK